MNRKDGAYMIPPEIQALAPVNIPCTIEKQYYQPKKNGQPCGEKRIYYYRKAADDGAAVLLVTHENEAAQFADRVFTMDGGRLD